MAHGEAIVQFPQVLPLDLGSCEVANRAILQSLAYSRLRDMQGVQTMSGLFLAGEKQF